MNGEFKLILKEASQDQVTSYFKAKYGDKLTDAFNKSQYAPKTVMQEKDFCAGYHTDKNLFLVYTLEADTLRVYVETVNKQDLKVMKDVINHYFHQITGILKTEKQKWSNPQATIWLEDVPFYGSVKTRWVRIKERFAEQWKELFIVPIASFLASYLAIRFNILGAEDYRKDLEKAVILTLEAYIGLVFVLFIQLVRKNENEFTFNF